MEVQRSGRVLAICSRRAAAKC